MLFTSSLRFVFVCFIFSMACSSSSTNEDKSPSYTAKKVSQTKPAKKTVTSYSGSHKTIHVFVALCDNQYQGIVPVPEKPGNGQDPKNNLYWGAMYGVKSYFKRSAEWTTLEHSTPGGNVLERVIFKHKTQDYYLVADAYDGQFIKECTEDFLNSGAGLAKDVLQVGDTQIGTHGNAELLAYIGHDGLMDFELKNIYLNEDNQSRDAIILACYSREYFKVYTETAKLKPLVWTTGLMAPEAYTLHDALNTYVKGDSKENVRMAAAQAYAKYQKCSVRAARNLLVSN